MKVITSNTDFIAYRKIFKHLKANHCPLVVWQLMDEGKREVTNSRLNSFHNESKLLHFELNGTKFNPSLPIYCYAEDGQLIFKTAVHEVSEKYLSLVVPNEIKIIGESEEKVIRAQIGRDLSTVWRVKRLNLDKIDEGPDYIRVKSMAQRSSRDQDFLNSEFDGVSLDEEDRIFADKRESPRARPKVDKWVKVQPAGDSTIHRFKLFDLSRGGMGFVVEDNDLFPKGTEVHVLGFDEFDLDDPLVGQVMSLRPINEDEFEWKVGVKFNDGQG